jgi:tetratricopeptide (TPR) repeat protein
MVEALERLYAERVTEQIERLAHHATAAELWPKALAYNRQAGAKAAWRSAHREAVGYFERALRAGRRLPETAATTEQMVDLYLQLRWSLVPLGEYGMLAASLREAEAVVARSGDQHRLGELANSMTNFLRVVGDCDGALAAGERARAIGVALGERGLQLRATFQLGNVHRQLGDYHRAILEFEAAANALVDDLLYERFGEPSVLSVHARLWLAVSLTEVGRFDAAAEAGESAIRIADEAKNAYSLTNAHYGLGSVHLRRGNAARAIELLERAVALCREGSFMLLLPPTLSALGGALTLAGRLEEASPCLEFAVETAAAKGFLGSSSLYIARLAEARLLAGREREARELGLRALDAARKHKERGHEAWALYLLGRLDAAGGAAASACEVLTQALSLADERGMRPLVAHCHATLGGLYARSDRRDDGRDHLLRAAALFREMGMGGWLEKTESELAKLA